MKIVSKTLVAIKLSRKVMCLYCVTLFSTMSPTLKVHIQSFFIKLHKGKKGGYFCDIFENWLKDFNRLWVHFKFFSYVKIALKF